MEDLVYPFNGPFCLSKKKNHLSFKENWIESYLDKTLNQFTLFCIWILGETTYDFFAWEAQNQEIQSNRYIKT